VSRADKNKVSFPITVWFVPQTGQIEIVRPTERGFRASISNDPAASAGHPQLYQALRRVLLENESGFAETPRKYN